MTQTIHSSCRLYYEDNRTPLHFQQGDYVTVPCGIARFPKREGPLPAKRRVERGYNIQHSTEMSRGGHFPATRRAGTVGGGYSLVFPSVTLVESSSAHASKGHSLCANESEQLLSADSVFGFPRPQVLVDPSRSESALLGSREWGLMVLSGILHLESLPSLGM
jgi:hypothetical protein